MTFFEFCEKYNLKPLSKGEDREIKGGFAGDLHSWAMANAEENHAWFTIMGNINAIAVAALHDIGCVVICQNSQINEDALSKAKEEGIWVFASELSVFEAAGKYYQAIR